MDVAPYTSQEVIPFERFRLREERIDVPTDITVTKSISADKLGGTVGVLRGMYVSWEKVIETTAAVTHDVKN
jgi:hypothetical protein